MSPLFVPAQTSRRRTVARAIGGVVAALALLVGGFVAATWAPDKSVAELQARWAPPPSVFVDVAGMKVHMRDEGVRDDPVPIVMLHGTSASLHTWEGWVQALSGKRRLISFDLPGFGLTGPSPNGDYTMESYVAFVRALLDKLGIQRAVLVGNSFGGAVAWNSAIAMPERVDKLVLVDSGGYPFKPVSVPIGFRIAQTPVLNRMMLVTLPRSVIESSVRDAYGDPSKVTPELVDRYYELTLREGNRRALLERFKQSPSDEAPQEIPKVKTPTLIVWGGRDRDIPPDNAERFHHDIAGSQVVMFDDLGHVPQEEDPVRTVTAVKQFLHVE
jgi:pimeloyl-ACP methyl ester carboxylesterase